MASGSDQQQSDRFIGQKKEDTEETKRLKEELQRQKQKEKEMRQKQKEQSS